MAKMTTLTINGKSYEVEDPDSVSCEESQELTEEQQMMARRNIGAAVDIDDSCVGEAPWSSKNTVDKLHPSFAASGAVVTCEPVEGYPLEVISVLKKREDGVTWGSIQLTQVVNGTEEIVLIADINEDCPSEGTYNWTTGILMSEGTNPLQHNPETNELTPIADLETYQPTIVRNILAYPGENTFYSDCGDTTVTGRANLKASVEMYTQELKETAEAAAVIDDTRAGEGAWSSKNIVDKLCPAFEESGSVVSCDPVEGYPLGVVTQITPVQSGSGDPSPENIRPITGHTACNLYHSGKNLLKAITGVVENSEKSGRIDINGNTVILSTIGDTAANVAYENWANGSFTLPAGTYTISATKVSGSVEKTNLEYYIGLRNANNAWVMYIPMYGGVSKSRTFTLTKTTDVAWKVLANSAYGFDSLTFNVQIEAGDTATEFEPYKDGSNTVTLDLGQTVYGGSLDWKTGVLIIDRGIYDLGAFVWEAWDINEEGWAIIRTHDLEGVAHDWTDPDSADASCRCSHYAIYPAFSIHEICNDYCIGYLSEYHDEYGIEAGLYLENDDFVGMTIEEITAALSGVQFSIPLKNPITVQLTPQEVLALAGTNYLCSDTGDTAASGRADPGRVIENLQNTNTEILERISELEAAIIDNT